MVRHDSGCKAEDGGRRHTDIFCEGAERSKWPKNDKTLDKITKKLTNFNCSIEINGNLKINVTLTSNSDNLENLDKQKEFMPNMLIYNLNDLNSFVNSKNSFENLSIFTYYPYKLFQEVLYE